MQPAGKLDPKQVAPRPRRVHPDRETAGFADTFDELGFEIGGAERVDERTSQAPYHTYTLMALPAGDDPRGNLRAVATGDIDPSDAMLDILLIENRLVVLGGSD